MTTRW